MPTIQNGSDLFKIQSDLLNGKRPVNGTNTVNTAQIWNAGEATVNRKLTGQLGNLSLIHI